MSNDRETDVEKPIEYLGVAMLKAILMLLLAVVGTSEAATDFGWAWDKKKPPKNAEAVYPDAVKGWVKVASKPTYMLFINPASIRKVGYTVEMFHLYELQLIDQVAGTSFRSVKAQAEYNCTSQQSRILSAAAYSGSMGNTAKITAPAGGKDFITVEKGSGGPTAGIVNRISEPGKWKPVTPGSTEEILWKYACGK
jgi:hypothetical protein